MHTVVRTSLIAAQWSMDELRFDQLSSSSCILSCIATAASCTLDYTAWECCSCYLHHHQCPFHVCSQNESTGGCEAHCSGAEQRGASQESWPPFLFLPSNSALPWLNLGESKINLSQSVFRTLNSFQHMASGGSILDSFDFSSFSDTVGLRGPKS